MNKKMKWLGIFALAASLLLTACGAQPTEAVPTSTPEPTATAEPTATPEATAAEPTEEPPPSRYPSRWRNRPAS